MVTCGTHLSHLRWLQWFAPALIASARSAMGEPKQAQRKMFLWWFCSFSSLLLQQVHLTFVGCGLLLHTFSCGTHSLAPDELIPRPFRLFPQSQTLFFSKKLPFKFISQCPYPSQLSQALVSWGWYQWSVGLPLCFALLDLLLLFYSRLWGSLSIPADFTII